MAEGVVVVDVHRAEEPSPGSSWAINPNARTNEARLGQR